MSDQLRAEVQRLKLEVDVPQSTTASHAHRSHNKPPDLVDADAQPARKGLLILWDALNEVDQELARPEPDPSRLTIVGGKLWEEVCTIVEYCGKLGDAALTKAAETLGTAGVKVSVGLGAAYVAANQPQFKAVVDGLLKLAKVLGSP
ncbi:MAG: hypothetical protein AAFY03_05940 [Pseudomonadota bacterium]